MKPACLLLFTLVIIGVTSSEHINNGDELVGRVLQQCGDIGCVKEKVLNYLDTILNIQGSDARDIKVIYPLQSQRLSPPAEYHFLQKLFPKTRDWITPILPPLKVNSNS